MFFQAMMHYWQEVLKVMEITGRNPSSRLKDSQIRGRSPSVWEFFFLLQGLKLSKNVQKLFLDSFRLMTLKIAINMLDLSLLNLSNFIFVPLS